LALTRLPRRAPTSLNKSRGTRGILRSRIDVKSWRSNLPSVSILRPARCPSCGLAGREPGKRLGLIGHGVRLRQLWTLGTWNGEAEIVDITLRRYLCRGCGAVVTVSPTEMIHRHLFCASTLALALALWSIDGQSSSTVRKKVSPMKVVGPTAMRRWNSLRRWSRAGAQGQLWPRLHVHARWTHRKVAGRLAQNLASRGPPGASVLARVFAGAAQLR